jgi:hypothetical protein
MEVISLNGDRIVVEKFDTKKFLADLWSKHEKATGDSK